MGIDTKDSTLLNNVCIISLINMNTIPLVNMNTICKHEHH